MRRGAHNLAEIARTAQKVPQRPEDGHLAHFPRICFTAHGDEVALTSRGSSVRLDDTIAERLARNPVDFTAKNNATHSSGRKLVAAAIANASASSAALRAHPLARSPGALEGTRVATPFHTASSPNTCPQRPVAVLQAFKTATEPDGLIFETLPVLLTVPVRRFRHCGDGGRLTPSLWLRGCLGQLRAGYPGSWKGLEAALEADLAGRTRRWQEPAWLAPPTG